jgi:hypothetical protein
VGDRELRRPADVFGTAKWPLLLARRPGGRDGFILLVAAALSLQTYGDRSGLIATAFGITLHGIGSRIYVAASAGVLDAARGPGGGDDPMLS